MIQRIQTLFLILSALIATVLFITPLPPPCNITLAQSLIHIKTAPNLWSKIAAVGNLILIAYNLVIIFIFRKRLLQISLCWVLAITSIFFAALLYFALFSVEATFAQRWPVVLPLISSMLALLSVFFIKRDEQLVRAADRIR